MEDHKNESGDHQFSGENDDMLHATEENGCDNGYGKDRYTLFWRRESAFSQHHPAEFEVDGVKYNCAEQYMMQQKAALFGDADAEKDIMESHKAVEQKRLGERIANYDPKVWDEKSWDIVKKGNLAKFSQNPELKAELFKTDGTILAEASPFDRVWGIGLRMIDPRARHRSTWQGKNRLGAILTDVRDQMMKQEGFDLAPVQSRSPSPPPERRRSFKQSNRSSERRGKSKQSARSEQNSGSNKPSGGKGKGAQSSGDYDQRFLELDMKKLKVDTATLKTEEGRQELEKERLLLERERLEVEKERRDLEKERLALERERLAFDKENLAFNAKKLALKTQALEGVKK